MAKTAAEVATVIGVAAAVIAGLLFASGTLVHLSYFHGLGFDAHQFPALGSELHLSGMVYGVLPALFVGVVALTFACLFALGKRAEDWLNCHPVPAKWRRLIGLVIFVLVIFAAGVVWAVLSPPATLTQWIVATIIVATIVSSVILLWKWMATIVVGCFIGGLTLVLLIQYVSGKAYEAGKARAAEAGNSHAITSFELTDGHKITVPGLLIVCSERFCGFHDGKTATVISLEGVRRIQSPAPQEQPHQTSDK